MTDTILRDKPIVRRQRGKLRLQVLLNAAASLLAENDVSEVGLYQIAERAGVPAASIYHFFPNKEAAFLALAEEYSKGFAHLALEPVYPPPERWQDLVEQRVYAAAAHYNSNPALMRLFLGAAISVDVRRRDLAGTTEIGRLRAEILQRYFVMPPVPGLELRLAVSVAIADGIWALSYNQHRRVTEAFVEESVRATIAYLRLFLPEYIEPRLGSHIAPESS